MELILQFDLNAKSKELHIFSVEQKNGTKDELMVALATELRTIQTNT